MNKTHKCNHALICKSEDCSHAVPHEPKGCDTQAPCGNWPEKPHFKPMVKCILKEYVIPRQDCGFCGEKEGKGHHLSNCVNNLRKQNKKLRKQLKELNRISRGLLHAANVDVCDCGGECFIWEAIKYINSIDADKLED